MDTTRFIYAGTPGPGHGPWQFILDTPASQEKALADGHQAFSTMSFEYEPEQGKPEPMRYGDLWLDIDCGESPKVAIIAARFIVQRLSEDYDGFNPDTLHYFMSGSKGVHIRIPAEIFGGENGHPYLPLLHKRMLTLAFVECSPSEQLGLLGLRQGIPRTLENKYPQDLIDFSLYSMGKGHLLRAPNIRRPDGRYKVQVSAKEFFYEDITTLLDMTRKPRHKIIPVADPVLTQLSAKYDDVLLMWQTGITENIGKTRFDGCQFLAHCKENAASLSEHEWFMMIRILARLGKRGLELAHIYSKRYPNYSKSETHAKFMHALNKNYSGTCDAIQEVFICEKRCPVRSPLELEGKQDSQKCVAANAFQLKEDGVYYSPTQGMEDDGVCICTPLRIIGKMRLQDNTGWGRLVQITTPDGTINETIINMKDFAGRGDVVRALLLDHGLEVTSAPKASSLLMDYLRLSAPEGAFITNVEQLGWMGDTYILPDIQIGGKLNSTLHFSSRKNNLFKKSGTLEDWQNNIGRCAQGNKLLVLGLSFALTGPLLRPCNVEGGGLHISGGSSSGKTTLALIVGSVCGGGGNLGFVGQWRSTDNALEHTAALHNDNLLVLDEIGQAASDTVSRVAYMLPNGQGKERMRSDASHRKANQWKLNFLSTGEMSLSDKIEENGRGRAMAGQEVRVINLAIGQDEGMRVFDNLYGYASAAALSDHLKQASQDYYGTPLRAFLMCLCGDSVEDKAKNLEKIENNVVAFVREYCPSDASGQVKRAARKFGFMAAAGMFAVEKGIFPLAPREPWDAAAHWFRHWITFRNGTGDLEIEKALERIKDFFDLNGDSRFIEVDAISHNNPRLAGYKWEKDGETHYLMMIPIFNDQARGCNKTQLIVEMKRRKWLVVNSNGNIQETKSVKGANKRGYVFRPCAWSGPCVPEERPKVHDVYGAVDMDDVF